MPEQSSTSPVWKINASFLRATAGAGLAWGAWEISATPGFEITAYMAVVFGVVAVKHAVIAMVGVIKLILRQRKWAKYQRQGAAPKADGMADVEDLKRRGLIK